MIITSVLGINMTKMNKVSISSIISEGNVEEPTFEIDEIGIQETHLRLVNNLDEEMEPADAIYKNENELKGRALDQITSTIEMYKDLLGDVASCLKKYDVRLDSQ